MVIQIRGTSGSGKSTVMREVMSEFAHSSEEAWEPKMVKGRRKPFWYKSDGGAIVLGHYETPCGGCDTLGAAPQAYEAMLEALKEVPVVLGEGLLLSEDSKWTPQLPKPVHVLFLTTDVETCLARIRHRREEAGNTKPLAEHNTRNRLAVIERARVKLTGLGGVVTRRASGTQATDIILNWIWKALEGRDD